GQGLARLGGTGNAGALRALSGAKVGRPGRSVKKSAAPPPPPSPSSRPPSGRTRQRAGRHLGGRDALAVLPHDVRLHGVVGGQPQLVHVRGGAAVPVLDALPELALVGAREGRLVLL